ncbi:MAG: J domain-containing protein, partial [Elainellaceae cyanobacterium]
MDDLERWYRVLDLEPGASMDDVNQSYKDLVFIWHPDRIPKDNTRLQQKAQEKLKQLNQARDRLRTLRRNGSGTSTDSTTKRTTRSTASKSSSA